MTYGYFDDDSKEYVITNPLTPVKWINYIGTIAFGGFVDHTGGALLCCGDPALNRITRYLSFLVAGEMRGTTAYIRIKDASGYRLLSPFYLPSPEGIISYECRIGTQYLILKTDSGEFESEICIFVPVDEKLEIRDVRIHNKSDKTLKLDFIPAVEYSHFDALKQLTNADWVPQTMQSRAVKSSSGSTVLLQSAYMNRDTMLNYFSSSRAASSFETDRRVFIGSNEYGSWKSPAALSAAELPGTEAKRGDNIAVLMIPLEIAPGKTERFFTMLGQADSEAGAVSAVERFSSEDVVNSAFSNIKNFWDEHLSYFQAKTPADDMNSMVNIHNPRQCYITKNWARYLSIYQTGYGARGIGFRDACQDVCGIISQKPAEAADYLLEILKTQKTNGSAMHQYNPLSGEAHPGETEEMPDRPQYYGDDHLWAVYAVCSLIKETGDTSFLDKEIRFYDSDESASVLEHLLRALKFTGENTGAHGLPLLGFADWNDTVNLPAGAESSFIACLYGFALSEMIQLLEYCGLDSALVERLQADYVKMKDIFNAEAWVGDWYVRYFDHRGKALGAPEDRYASIFANAQSWAVLSGFAPRDRAVRALDSVNRRLATEAGIKLMSPGYEGYDPEKGGVTTYPPGAKENAGIFLHANPWVMIAESMLGNGERAFDYYCAINPAAKNEIIDTYECEPYCYAQNILSDEHPCFGLGRNSWLTGTAAWAYRAATEYILGIRPVFEGLKIDPCIPASWDGFTVKRKFRGIDLSIKISNPESCCGGVREFRINGLVCPGNVITEDLLRGMSRSAEVEAVLL